MRLPNLRLITPKKIRSAEGAASITLAAFLSAASVGAASGPAPDARPQGDADLSAVAAIGKALFSDPTLSASGQMSCASCHDPKNHFAPSNARAVQLGGPHLDLPGLRAVPSLTYRRQTPPFTFGVLDPTSEAGEAAPQAVAQQGAGAKETAGPSASTQPAPRKTAGAPAAASPVPRGGLFWDGRADTLQEQALAVLFTHFEMAEPERATLAATLRARYGDRFAQLFGGSVRDDDKMLIDEAAFALSRYQTEAVEFHPYTSKYDAVLAGEAQLSPPEARGRALFDDPRKGNCAACHLDTRSADGRPPQFTDYEYEALGVPRNPAIPANADPHYVDLGLCGPLRHDAISTQPGNCGMFKTPSLRNVATRHVFFHNGVYTSLKQVLRFYAKRDSDPRAIYPIRDGQVERFDDLPARYQGNIDRADAPFGRAPEDGDALTEADQADIIAFLQTLTDGYSPSDE
ncbi:cytochrome c peroxidase [Thioclava sp. F36-6]|uniref:cytochrome c peroxidase n=1 Tax=Thioclava sp. F36-6 TaxID=1915316 RepID=UPI0009971901|nr:cytochrome c peroxidase [Thioclava sp. F36-6]OOY32108.1 cytochrome-c peroxidase [Thioclava sp. F36-6]